MTNATIELIESLTNANGAPGFEDQVLSVIREKLADSVQVNEDHIRNLYLRTQDRDDSKPLVMVEGHSDEVAFMAQSFSVNGMIHILPLGGWHNQTMMGHKVRVQTISGKYIPGVIASKPPHFMTAREIKEGFSIQEMLVDVGASSIDELVYEYQIELGAPIVPDVNFEFNEKNGLMLAKAFDNRIGCAAVVQCLSDFSTAEHEVDIIGVIASQEEVGLRGIKVAAANVKPDAAIIFEGSPADDTYGDKTAFQGALKKGPQIRHHDRSMIANPRFVKFARDVAKEMKIPFQDTVRHSGGTDGGEVHLTNNGVPTIVIGIPTRYAHTHHCFCALKDYQIALDWCREIIKRLDKNILNGF